MATPTPAGLPLWPLLALLAALLVASFWIANAIAWILQLRRARRIARKTEQLARLGPAASRNGAANSQQACPPVVPVTILTGFLGAGKTTLLNRILLAPDVPFKVMVLENEVGAISIDHALLQRPRRLSEQRAGASDDGIYVLQNGCMCCLSRGTRNVSELERIVDYLLRISNEKGFDYLVVETTGLADPGPIIETFLRLRASRFRLDAIVAMVDAHSTQRYWSETTGNFKFPVELQRQLLYADAVALNKVDLAGGEEIKRLERAIGKINEEATVYQCRNADLDLTQIINVNTFDAVKFRQAAGKELVNDEEDGSLDIWTRGFHTDGIVTVHFEADASVDIAAFSEWLTGVVNRYSKAEVLRIKGILSVEGEDAKCVVQCVLDTYTIAPSAGNWEKEERRASKLVMIGEQLDREELEDGFRRCLVGNQEIGATEPKKER